MDINIRRTSLDRVSRIPKQVTPEWYWTELNGKPYCDVDGTSRREQLLRTKFPRSFGWPCSVRVRWLQPDEIINKLFHEAFSRNWQFRETLTYRFVNYQRNVDNVLADFARVSRKQINWPGGHAWCLTFSFIDWPLVIHADFGCPTRRVSNVALLTLSASRTTHPLTLMPTFR